MKSIALTGEAIVAVKCKAPTDKSLLELLNGWKSIDDYSRQVRWLAHKELTKRGYEFTGLVVIDPRQQPLPFDPDNLGDI